ncbi:MAG: hypothetical protein KJO98_11465 [Rhodothermia bacterium]|nr:hypothetical protein [Rhodothermia bacterium]
MDSGKKHPAWSSALALAAAMCYVAGCAIVDGAEEDAIFGLTTAGIVSLGFEDSTFLPCQSSEAWWLSWYDGVELWRMYEEKASKPHEQVYAVLRGDRSRQGAYGHLDGYDRSFVVAEVIEMRRLHPEDCERFESVDPR